MTRKWIKVNDLSSGQYSVCKSVMFKPLTLRSDLCDCIALGRRITVEGSTLNTQTNKKLFSKNNLSF